LFVLLEGAIAKPGRVKMMVPIGNSKNVFRSPIFVGLRNQSNLSFVEKRKEYSAQV